LRGLDGQRVALQLTSPPLALQVRVDGDALRVGPVDADREPDLGVRTTLAGLLGQSRCSVATMPAGRQAAHRGDAELARRLQQLAQNFDPDWQQPFVSVFGDVIGVQIAKAVAAGLKAGSRSRAEPGETAAEFVTEESRDVVRAELDAFHDDVDALRDDVERIAAKIARLQRERGAGT
jgi:ubiquinone biosynthesis protein UbiJ